ncbi:paraquat-inducible membrane protein A [Meridianimarinicoccus roseus]|uniref:Paraquat-inducible membrane protein A n=1 Tax=Meridianimarinicoccus roseus TaxID=2072018 RepID=A0A2V2LFQ3_9RHOB|nr:paraquat-inducible protein A [Meridianimarinicoccus roseus]PWR02731.1 paraquat-inducible membrane protein A [Meridianimarinicoccus roseus]
MNAGAAHGTVAGRTARSAGLVGCLHCGLLAPMGETDCLRCGARLESRFRNSRQRVWAWWLAGLIVYVPANLYPMMITDTLLATYSSTIIGGAMDLVTHGDVFVGLIVLIASVMIPVGKFLAIAWVMIATRKLRPGGAHRLHRMYEVVEFIGRWSMIDVFVVAILAALVHLGSVAGIFPGLAAICFGASVIFTMLAALSLDPRMIWDAADPNAQDPSA